MLIAYADAVRERLKQFYGIELKDDDKALFNTIVERTPDSDTALRLFVSSLLEKKTANNEEASVALHPVLNPTQLKISDSKNEDMWVHWLSENVDKVKLEYRDIASKIFLLRSPGDVIPSLIKWNVNNIRNIYILKFIGALYYPTVEELKRTIDAAQSATSVDSLCESLFGSDNLKRLPRQHS